MLSYFKFHHIGIATFDIQKTAELYIAAGYTASSVIIDSIQNIKICFLSKANEPLLELLEPIDDKSPVCKTLDKIGVSPYHCCYTVPSIDEAIKDLKFKKFIPIIKPVPAIAIEDKKICFLYHKDIGLIEIVEQ